MHFEFGLPEEVAQEISSFCQVETLFKLGLVNRAWNSLLMETYSSTRIWKNLCYKTFSNNTYIDKKTQKNLKLQDWKYLAIKETSKPNLKNTNQIKRTFKRRTKNI